MDAAQQFREVLASTGDPLSAIRAVRERFGLSLPEAKELWLQSVGTSDSLDAHQAKLVSSLTDTLKGAGI